MTWPMLNAQENAKVKEILEMLKSLSVDEPLKPAKDFAWSGKLGELLLLYGFSFSDEDSFETLLNEKNLGVLYKWSSILSHYSLKEAAIALKITEPIHNLYVALKELNNIYHPEMKLSQLVLQKWLEVLNWVNIITGGKLLPAGIQKSIHKYLSKKSQKLEKAKFHKGVVVENLARVLKKGNQAKAVLKSAFPGIEKQ